MTETHAAPRAEPSIEELTAPIPAPPVTARARSYQDPVEWVQGAGSALALIANHEPEAMITLAPGLETRALDQVRRAAADLAAAQPTALLRLQGEAAPLSAEAERAEPAPPHAELAEELETAVAAASRGLSLARAARAQSDARRVGLEAAAPALLRAMSEKIEGAREALDAVLEGLAAPEVDGEASIEAHFDMMAKTLTEVDAWTAEADDDVAAPVREILAHGMAGLVALNHRFTDVE